MEIMINNQLNIKLGHFTEELGPVLKKKPWKAENRLV